MNEKLNNVLAELATKMGTTVQYLWGILIKQAYVTIWVDIAQIVGVVLYWLLLYKLHKWFAKEPEHGLSIYEEHEALPYLFMIVLGIIGAVFTIAVLMVNITEILTASINPEYWALDQVLKAIK